jgi:hypothetical protein
MEGLTFRLDVVEYGGRIICGYTPYNYTEKCWVDANDAEAVKTRWNELIPEGNQHVDPGEHLAQEVAYILGEHRKEVCPPRNVNPSGRAPLSWHL